jgi:acyl carrier protein
MISLMKTPGTPSDSRLLEVIAQTVAFIKDSPQAPVKSEQTFVGDLGLDSLQIMKMALELEDRLGIVIEEGAEFEIQTVADLVVFLKTRFEENGDVSSPT